MRKCVCYASTYWLFLGTQIDLQLESGEYFLKAQERKAKSAQEAKDERTARVRRDIQLFFNLCRFS